MADKRYEWLDEGTAERLLRGEPVEPPEGEARTQAVRLNQALRTVRGPRLPGPGHSDGGEMPGEARALAAFREARADAVPAGGAAGGPRSVEDAQLGIVRLAPPPRPALSSRLLGPVRFGVVAAVAGFAFGGVAVAAGAGLLPSPFDESPAGSSVSGAGQPGQPATESPRARIAKSPPPGTAGGAKPGASPSADGPDAPSTTPSTPSSAVTGPSGSATVSREGDRRPGGGPDPVPGERRGGNGHERHRALADACRDHRDGTIGRVRERWLEKIAKGPHRVERFCDQVLDGEQRRPEKVDKPDKSGYGGGAGGSGGEGKGKGQGNGKGHGKGKGKGHGKGKDKGRGEGKNEEQEQEQGQEQGQGGGRGSQRPGPISTPLTSSSSPAYGPV
ncbi:hypothetical protein [Streptomyces jumonjinensis]|uniref:Extensin n=1 Tax=Streptomyces jumonjinensis TaxID=1945 RepID=A0A646KEF3_STRJU|nr:hypothetical protein [Streptomyces jumonjinensis]MQT00662.1 hypothetical protein [Streptomyces jumonjinensis]